MGLTEMLFLCRGWTSKIFRRAAIADSAVLWEVIIVGNRCVYRENVQNEKCFFFFLNLRKQKLHVEINLPYGTFADI